MRAIEIAIIARIAKIAKIAKTVKDHRLSICNYGDSGNCGNPFQLLSS